MRHQTDQASSTAQILAIVGHSHRAGGPFELDDNNEFLQKDEPVSSLPDDNATEGDQEQGQTSDDTLGRTLTPQPDAVMNLAVEMKHLLRELQLLINQLRLCHDGVEMDPSITNALSIKLQKLQRSLAMANLRFKEYSGPDRQEIQDNL